MFLLVHQEYYTSHHGPHDEGSGMVVCRCGVVKRRSIVMIGVSGEGDGPDRSTSGKREGVTRERLMDWVGVEAVTREVVDFGFVLDPLQPDDSFLEDNYVLRFGMPE